jgi:ABC-type siderophore export system fused ATPase/permease subunit
MTSQHEQNPKTLASPPRELSEDTVNRLLKAQTMELQTRSEELKLRHRELDHNSAHAEKILNAQERDRNNTRKHIRRVNYANLAFAILVIVVVAVLIGTAMVLDKDALAADLLKISVSVAAGAVGGYGLARSRQHLKTDDE